jgi:hypothetical protein
MDDALFAFDFVDVFPAKMWVSHWATDAEYPAGYRYKMMSALRARENVVELLVVLEQRSGDKEVLEQLTIRPDAIDRIGRRFADGLSEKFGLDFEEQDFTNCRTEAAFESAARRYGWSMMPRPHDS